MRNYRRLIRRYASIGTFVIGLGANVLVAGVSQAHDPNEYFDFKWKTGTIEGVDMDKSSDWRFVDNFPHNGARDDVRAAAYQWSKQNSTMKFNYESGQPDYDSLQWNANCPYPRTQAGYQKSKVGWGDIGADGYPQDGEALGVTTYCVFANHPNTLYWFKIKMNTDAPWAWGSETLTFAKYDLQSAIAHEFGHATGRAKGGVGSGHFGESWDVCPDYPNNGNRHTMCPAVESGTTVMRSLEQHDIDTFNQGYP